MLETLLVNLLLKVERIWQQDRTRLKQVRHKQLAKTGRLEPQGDDGDGDRWRGLLIRAQLILGEFDQAEGDLVRDEIIGTWMGFYFT